MAAPFGAGRLERLSVSAEMLLPRESFQLLLFGGGLVAA